MRLVICCQNRLLLISLPPALSTPLTRSLFNYVKTVKNPFKKNRHVAAKWNWLIDRMKEEEEEVEEVDFSHAAECVCMCVCVRPRTRTRNQEPKTSEVQASSPLGAEVGTILVH